MEIDIQGAKAIQNTHHLGLRPWFVFIEPPDIQRLVERLALRGTETQKEIDLRVSNAQKELAEARASGMFHHTIVNDDFPQTVNLFFRLVRDRYPAIPSAARFRMLQRRIRK
ncbi:hypothetical protein B484DRAFT_410080, partial [Ochromonadaceae sp. CCMP2298]